MKAAMAVTTMRNDDCIVGCYDKEAFIPSKEEFPPGGSGKAIAIGALLVACIAGGGLSVTA
jgi:hypothetical protein